MNTKIDPRQPWRNNYIDYGWGTLIKPAAPLMKFDVRVTWPNVETPAHFSVMAADEKAARLAAVNVVKNGPYPTGWHIREVTAAAGTLAYAATQEGK